MSDDNISIDDFLKVDLRVGLVVAADRVPKSNKLIRMDVDFGSFKRQILAGVGKVWTSAEGEPGSLPGKKFLFVINLAPRTMMGLESHGMLLAAPYTSDGLELLALLSPTNDADCPPGSKFG